MATEQVVEEQHEDSTAYAGVLRFYELAKRAEWQVRDMPWGEIPPIPETKGTPQKIARRRDMWRSVVLQLLRDDGAPHVPPACDLLRRALCLGDRRDLPPRHVADLPFRTLGQLVETENARVCGRVLVLLLDYLLGCHRGRLSRRE